MPIELRRLERDSHERCSRCGRTFEEGDTAHAGFLVGGLTAYVGDCCASELVETSTRTHWSPKPYERPPLDAVLWRYMDLAKLVALLKDRAVYFARADQLGDPFEGAKGTVQRKPVWDAHMLNFFQSALTNPPTGVDFNLSPEQVDAEAKRLLNELDRGGASQRLRTFVSCWHESPFESEALWAKYGGLAVAVRTNVASLNKSLGDDPSISIGRVRYIDLSNHFAGLNEAFFRKRLSFQHEKEVRAVTHTLDKNPVTGRNMPADLDVLITAVVVSPLAPPWFPDVVEEVLKRFECRANLMRSEMLHEPFF